MKILVISGFLGAGKTTFIKELAKRTQKDFAIMENEYGAVGVDGGILDEAASGMEKPINIWELTEGCICCSMKTDFASSILTIANTVDPEYLVVEPTGVGMLSKIIENIRKIQYERITLLRPVTILDGNMFERCMKEFNEICEDQIQAAGTIIVSKMENADEEELKNLEERLCQMNTDAEICTSHYTNQDETWWNSLLEKELDQIRKEVKEETSSDLESLGLTDIGLEHESQLLLFLQGIISGVFGDICRAKGYLKVGMAYLRFDVTDHTYSITGIEAMPDSRGVFIGKNIKRSWIREILQKDLYGERTLDKIRKSGRPMKRRSRV